MSKSILIIDTPSSCDNCPLCIGLDRYRCAINKRWCGDEQGCFTSSTMPTWCPLKEEKKAIPIEWINHYTTGLIFSDDYVNNTECIDDYIYCIDEMVRDWEKENAKID